MGISREQLPDEEVQAALKMARENRETVEAWLDKGLSLLRSNIVGCEALEPEKPRRPKDNTAESCLD